MNINPITIQNQLKMTVILCSDSNFEFASFRVKPLMKQLNPGKKAHKHEKALFFNVCCVGFPKAAPQRHTKLKGQNKDEAQLHLSSLVK